MNLETLMAMKGRDLAEAISKLNKADILRLLPMTRRMHSRRIDTESWERSGFWMWPAYNRTERLRAALWNFVRNVDGWKFLMSVPSERIPSLRLNFRY